MMVEETLYCLKAQHWKLPNGIGIWDVVMFIPACLFLMLLLVSARHSYRRLKESPSTIILIYYLFAWALSLSVTLACVLAFIWDDTIASQFFRLLALFVFLFVELNVLLFLLHGTIRSSRRSVKTSILLTAITCVIYVTIQGILQFVFDWDIYHRDGAAILYWFARSLFFFLIYVTILIVPCTRLKKSFPFPVKPSFYCYIFYLLVLNILQIVGCLCVYFYQNIGYCFIDISAFGYIGFFPWVIYFTYLFTYFRTKREGAHFYDVINTAYREAQGSIYSNDSSSEMDGNRSQFEGNESPSDNDLAPSTSQKQGKHPSRKESAPINYTSDVAAGSFISQATVGSYTTHNQLFYGSYRSAKKF